MSPLVVGTGVAFAAPPSWQYGPTAPVDGSERLNSVVVTGSARWAFGAAIATNGDQTPIAERWDGQNWRSVALPTDLHQGIAAAAANGPDDIWAVGGLDNGQDSFVLHWDGHVWTVAKRWVGAEDGALTDIEVFGRTNVWVFGASHADQGLGTWHFDGSQWTSVDGDFGRLPLAQASAVSPCDIWAIYYGAPADGVRRWNGSEWQAVDLPDITGGDPDTYVTLYDIYARSAADVWVGGEVTQVTSDGSITLPLVLRFDGGRWHRLDLPGTDQSIRQLAGDGRGGVWAAPRAYAQPVATPYILHYTAGKWQIEPLTAPAGKEVNVYDIALLGGGHGIAVGRTYLDNGQALPSDGASWTEL